jgi:hypothetical protein
VDELEMHFAGVCIVQDQAKPAQTMSEHLQDGFAPGLGDAGPALRVRQEETSIWPEMPLERIADTPCGSFLFISRFLPHEIHLHFVHTA